MVDASVFVFFFSLSFIPVSKALYVHGPVSLQYPDGALILSKQSSPLFCLKILSTSPAVHTPQEGLSRTIRLPSPGERPHRSLWRRGPWQGDTHHSQITKSAETIPLLTELSWPWSPSSDMKASDTRAPSTTHSHSGCPQRWETPS